MGRKEIQMPFNTDTRIYDDVTGQYILTEQALIRIGIDLRGRLARTRAASPENVINGVLTSVSDMIYNYIHSFSVHNEEQDGLIACCEGARVIIERAMLKQATYFIFNGNLNLSTDDNIRNKAISPEAISILNRTIREIGSSILYTGV